MITSATAQQGVYIGVNATPGFNLIVNQNAWNTDENPQPELEYRNTFGFRPAAVLGYHFTPRIAIQTEVGYLKMGQKYEGVQYDLYTTREIRMNYVQIPLLFKYSSLAPNARFHFMIGPQVGILTGANADIYRTGDPLNQYEDKDVEERFNHVDVAIVTDIGTDIPVNSHFIITFGLRLHMSVKDINKEKWQLPNFSRDIYNSSYNAFAGVSVGANYVFKGKGETDKQLRKEMYEY